jgi:hypothetical protein
MLRTPARGQASTRQLQAIKKVRGRRVVVLNLTIQTTMTFTSGIGVQVRAIERTAKQAVTRLRALLELGMYS